MNFNTGGYNKQMYSHEEMVALAKELARRLPKLMQELRADAVVVRGTSGISMAAAVLTLIQFPLLLVRKPGESSHGNLIEGTPGVDVQRYLILDDFVSSGATVRSIVQALEEITDINNAQRMHCAGVLQYKPGWGDMSIHAGEMNYHIPLFCL